MFIASFTHSRIAVRIFRRTLLCNICHTNMISLFDTLEPVTLLFYGKQMCMCECVSE